MHFVAVLKQSYFFSCIRQSKYCNTAIFRNEDTCDKNDEDCKIPGTFFHVNYEFKNIFCKKKSIRDVFGLPFEEF